MAEQTAVRNVIEDPGDAQGRSFAPHQRTRGMVSLYSLLRGPLTVLGLMATDALALLTGLMLAAYLVGGEARIAELVYLAPILLSVWLAVFVACNLYGQGQSRRSPVRLLGAVLWGAGLLAIGAAMHPRSGFSPKEVLLGALFVLLLEGCLRLLYERMTALVYRWNVGMIPILVVGGEEDRARLHQAIGEKPSPYACVGELDTTGSGIDLPLLRRVLDSTGARQVIMAGAERLSDVQLLDLLRAMWLRKVKVRFIPDATALMSTEPVISRDMGVPLLDVGYPRLENVQWVLKRMLDIAGSLWGLVFLSPVFLAVALAIKRDSPGPVFFRQKRVGADEKTFMCYKFRSMYEDAERRQRELEAMNEADGAVFKIKDDPRITRVGGFLRRWSVDELPQLINVLKGEMSLVGPRPLPLRDFELMTEVQKRRLGAWPGMTGYWQISGRSNLSFEEMVRLDLYYIENWSLSFDLKIILRTLDVVLRRRGAC